MYTEHTDNTGHKYGPLSEEIKQAVRDLDDVIMQLFAGLESRGILDSGEWSCLLACLPPELTITSCFKAPVSRPVFTLASVLLSP